MSYIQSSRLESICLSKGTSFKNRKKCLLIYSSNFFIFKSGYRTENIYYLEQIPILS